MDCEHGPVLECPPCTAISLREIREKNKKKKPALVKRKKKAVDKTVSEVMRAMGRKGGLIGGKRRMETLTPEQRTELALKASRARWNK